MQQNQLVQDFVFGVPNARFTYTLTALGFYNDGDQEPSQVERNQAVHNARALGPLTQAEMVAFYSQDFFELSRLPDGDILNEAIATIFPEFQAYYQEQDAQDELAHEQNLLQDAQH